MCQNRVKGGGNGRAFCMHGLGSPDILCYPLSLSLLFLNHTLTSDYVFLQLSMGFLCCELKKESFIKASIFVHNEWTHLIQKYSSEEIYVFLSLFLGYHKTVLEIMNVIYFLSFILQNCKIFNTNNCFSENLIKKRYKCMTITIQ